MPVEQQYAVYRALELPARVLVHSGGKSLHAIVHIGAGSYSEYRDRVAYLYKVCEANGLVIDGQNKNPSRLSRMPGVLRGGKEQYIVAENQGYESFEAWREYIESVNDDLPDPQSLADVWDDLPPLSPPLIGGVLRQGHKMLLAGPSKAGKSFALMELCVAIAEGREWLGFPCAQGRVLYVNLEVDPASCWHRLKDVYTALGMPPDNIRNLDVWNLRGSAVPMDKLAPKLIRRAQKRDYLAVVIDPIYKVITGDENSADQMAAFCNQFDLIANRLGCAVIYCHHHSKGAQGGKASMDRASGSGVFARDPDTLLDMIELPVPESVRTAAENHAIIALCGDALNRSMMRTRWQDNDIAPDDLCSAPRMLEICRQRLAAYELQQLEKAVAAARQRQKNRTAWRIEGTLREFERFPPVNCWFDYPVHHMDEDGVLQDVKPESDQRGWAKGARRNQQNAPSRRQQKAAQLDKAVQAANAGEPPTLTQLADYLDCSERSVRDRIKESGKYVLDKNTRTIISAEKD
jgi:RecA-family ATPase